MVTRAMGLRPSGRMCSPFQSTNSNGGVPNIFNNLVTPRAAAEVADLSLGASVLSGAPETEPFARSADDDRLSSSAFTPDSLPWWRFNRSYPRCYTGVPPQSGPHCFERLAQAHAYSS